MLFVGKYTPELVAKVVSLVSQGIIKRISEFRLDKDNFSPEEVMAAVPLMALPDGALVLLVNLTADQWKELADKFGEEMSSFDMVSTTVDSLSVDSVAKVYSKVKKGRLAAVEFEDFDLFANSFEKYMGEEGARCEEFEFWKMNETEGVQGMAERIGWKAGGHDNCMVIRKVTEEDEG